MQIRSTLGAACLALATLGSLAAPAATVTAGSSASAVSASLLVNSKSGSLAPQVVASGSAPPAYTKTTKAASLSKSQTVDILTLSGTGNNIKDTVTGTTSGTVTSKATSSVGSFTAKVDSPIGNALTASATNLVTTASMAKTASGNTPAGSVSIGSLSINAPLFGITNKTYTGKPKPNTILYQNNDKTVTLYLNRQIKTTSGGKVVKISVSAINLHIVKLSASGQTISGDVFLATGNAN